ncbi:MAG: histidine phosphatase family protein [Clostridiales bacterium]|nr:histidine phosphatase family protein [Clostridiales bacterium]
MFENKEFDDWQTYSEEYKHYDNYYHNNGKFYAKFPQGESPFDVALRTRQFINTLFRDVQDGKENFFIVSHGTTIRAFLLSYFHYSPEWFNAEPNMQNCSVRLIEKIDRKNFDRDYIHGGRK